MATSITFTDGIGAATLTNGKPTPGDRFGNWVPMTRPVGDSVNRDSDGSLSTFIRRIDYGASFELALIPVATIGGVRLVDVADRLIAWLLQGQRCTVNTGDAESNSYALCCLFPGTTPTLMLADRRLLEYTLTLSLLNLGGTRMVCHYAA